MSRHYALHGALVLLLAGGSLAAQPPAAAPTAAPTATRHEIIRGTVTTGTDRKPVAGADVIATRAPDRAFKSTKTDSAGHFLIDWPDGTGDYLVNVSMVGFQTVRRRATAGAESVLVVDATLAPPAPQQLAAVVTTGRRRTPTRDPGVEPEVGTSEREPTGINGLVDPALAGDLAALAATLPGVLVTPQGPSVLGLGAAQNSTTLNGMSFPGADVPRDASTRTRISTSAYDPARGWFGGANTNVELGPGNIFSNRRSHVTLDAPPLQYTDAISRRLGQQYSNAQLSLGGDGELLRDRWYYNYGLQGGRRSADPATLLTATPELLRSLGIAPDSAARLRSILSQVGIPAAAGAPDAATNDNVSLIARFDHKPYDATTLGAAKSTWGLTTYARLGRTSRAATSPTATAAHDAKGEQTIGMVQGDWSHFFGTDYLATARSSVGWARNRTTPYATLPDARVLLQSDLGGGDGGVATLSTGGNAIAGVDQRQLTWETQGDVQFYAANAPRHRVRLNADSRLDTYTHDVSANQAGTFTYQSLADLQANRPASFIRTLGTPTRHGGAWNGFVAAGDLFRINPNWQILYGARVEGNAFTSVPAANPDVERLLGARTDVGPTSVHVSPRFGFTYNRSGRIRNARIGNPVGLFSAGTPGVLRGGFGEFRTLTSPTLLANAMGATGLPGATSRISCLGSAAPTPNWAAYAASSASIPTACAGNTNPSLADAAPNVQVFSPDWRTPRSWRGNLTWSSSTKLFDYTVEGLYSLNVNQPGGTDLNFAGTPRFTLPNEGRPVYVDPADIVPATGLVSTVGARRASSYGRVFQGLGDGRSVSKQATVTLAPNLIGSRLARNSYFSIGYTLASVRARQRGFDGTTFGDPRERTWIRGDLDARHQFVAQGGTTFGPFALTVVGRAQSGLPFTPVVGGDVNGDGLPNDRAFVSDPATLPEGELQSGLRALVASPSTSVRDCVRKTLGHVASANGCEGPWTTTMNARLGINNARWLGRRVGVGINAANVLGGIDQALHGASNLRGWGTMPTPDPVLFTVRGWNASTRAFDYAVNPRFASTRPQATTIRAPFRLTLDVSIDVGRTIESQQVDRWLRPGRTGPGLKATTAELKRRFDRNVPDLYRVLLQQSDSLLLSRDQVEALQRAQTTYRASIDSLWTALASHMADLPNDFKPSDEARRIDRATDAAWTMTRDDLQKNLKAILTPVQLRILPGPVKTLYETDGPVRIRLFIAG